MSDGINDEVQIVIPLDPSFETVCPVCWIVYPTHVGCGSNQCQGN